jgi:micrococcal nuclease
MKNKVFFGVLYFFIIILLVLHQLSISNFQRVITNTIHPTSKIETLFIQPTSFQTSPEMNYSKKMFKVTRIIDGDTIEIENNIRVRYIGIDSPEAAIPNSPIECFGKDASDKNKSLVLDKTVQLEKDISETDKYHRLLRYVYLSDGTMVNEELVKQGYARSKAYPPDIKYQERFITAQKYAENNNLGLWSTCR